ncbi:hypothetical protein LCGC14_0849550 [marine sediment metagenome]|uniref:Uncharacterized protein n=1 Tax=marine sediment metagenome TaxID=412755 RepID=A0A0F9PW05_9ZZZZ
MDDTGKHDVCFVCKKQRLDHAQGKLCKPTIEQLEKSIGKSDEAEILPNGDAVVKAEVDKLNEQLNECQQTHGKVRQELPHIGNPDFKEDCFALRVLMQTTEGQLMRVLHDHPAFNSTGPDKQTVEPQRGEMKACLMIAYRHLQDARMRVGKAIEAYDGGTSCYPR